MQYSPLDAELGAYKGRYAVSDSFFCDLLGKGGKPLYKDTYTAKRKGEREFTFREVWALSNTLGISLDELGELLPEINHPEE